MNYDELIRCLRDCWDESTGPTCDCDHCLFRGHIVEDVCYTDYTKCETAMVLAAADAIDELEFACNRYEKDYKALCDYLPKWIPVTERLPVYILGGEPLANMYLCYHVSEPMSWYQIDWWDGKKFVFKRQGRNDRVTHWMKPPAPPKEVGG